LSLGSRFDRTVDNRTRELPDPRQNQSVGTPDVADMPSPDASKALQR